MRAAERGEEVVQCRLVRQVQNVEAELPLHAISGEQVVEADAGIKQMTRRDPRRILVVIFRTVRRNPEQFRTVNGIVARRNRTVNRRNGAAAVHTDCGLLVWRKRESSSEVRH